MMKINRDDGKNPAELDQLIAQITTGAQGDDEQLRAFHRAIQTGFDLPCDAFVIGEPVSTVAFDYDGNQRRGLVARCRREDGSEHVVGAAEVVFAPQSRGIQLLAAYRKWLGLDSGLQPVTAPTRRMRQHQVAARDIDLSQPVELVVLSVKEKSARCRPVGGNRVITLRASRLWATVPGEVAVVKPGRQWSYAGHPYLSGELESARLDVAALGLVPLKLEEQGLWTPAEHYWGEENEPIEEWAKPIITRGPRKEFEIEQVVPGRDPGDQDSDPICESSELKEAGAEAAAVKILMELCQIDLRCLDAHAHLGQFCFDHRPKDAIRHFEVGVRIGELSLPPDFDGLLPWGHIANRPFLRCLHGYGMCLWRLTRSHEAERIFDRMLWFNPSDNQGVRFLLDEVRAGISWEDHREE